MKSVLDNIFKRRSRTVVGLDIGTMSVKAIELTRTGGRYYVMSAGKADLDLNGQNAQDCAVDAVGRCVRNCGLKSDLAVCAVNASDAAVRSFELEPMPREQADYAILVEAEHVSPAEMDKTVVDYQLIKPYCQGEKLTGMLVAAKACAVREKYDIVRRSSLNPVLMDVDTLALINCHVVLGDTHPDKTTAIIHINNEYTNLVILKNDSMPFIRNISSRGEKILSSVADHAKIDLARAKDEIFGASGNETLQHTVHKEFGRIINEIAGQVDQTLAYYSRQGNPHVDCISLCGDFACIDTVDNLFSERLGVKVEPWNPLAGLECSDHAAQKISDRQGCSMVVATGLALRGECLNI